MQCPAQVQQAMERINIGIELPNDAKLVSTWLDWVIAQQIASNDKCQESPAKRQKSLVAESQPCIAK